MVAWGRPVLTGGDAVAFGSFRQDRHYRELFSPGRDAVMVEPGLYATQDLMASEPGLFAFELVPYAIGYVTLVPYNVEAV